MKKHWPFLTAAGGVKSAEVLKKIEEMSCWPFLPDGGPK